jgi:hypothetical protein
MKKQEIIQNLQQLLTRRLGCDKLYSLEKMTRIDLWRLYVKLYTHLEGPKK